MNYPVVLMFRYLWRWLFSLFHADFLLGLFFDLRDGCDMFLRNVGLLSTDYMVFYPKTTGGTTSNPEQN
jgi:hypothetical protein